MKATIICFVIALLCISAYHTIGTEIDDAGILQEPFGLIPIAWLFVLLGVQIGLGSFLGWCRRGSSANRVTKNQRNILLAGMLVTLVLGSIHSFSVFLSPFESFLQLGRAEISLLYSFALIFLTVSVLFGYLVYELTGPGPMVIVACGTASIGLLISAQANSWWTLFVGYSLVFGTANGLGYGYVLQLVGRALPQQRGFSMAAVTAAYAVGSVIFSVILSKLLSEFSVALSLLTMSAVVASIGIVSGLILTRSVARYANQSQLGEVQGKPRSCSLGLWWLAYGCSVLAGLMAMGHAAGIVQSIGGEYSLAIWGSVWIGVGSALGGFLVGVVVNHKTINLYLTGLPVLSGVSLLLLSQVSLPLLAIVILCIVGATYGALIAVYPFAISVNFGEQHGPKIYGRVFTAWGLAGLAGPWCAGRLYDHSGSYSLALIIAAVIAFASSLCYLFIIKISPQHY